MIRYFGLGLFVGVTLAACMASDRSHRQQGPQFSERAWTAARDEAEFRYGLDVAIQRSRRNQR